MYNDVRLGVINGGQFGVMEGFIRYPPPPQIKTPQKDARLDGGIFREDKAIYDKSGHRD